jgi:predicted TIM-barrel fold metal-dependent hydrolase
MNDHAVLDFPRIEDIGPSPKRKPQKAPAPWPKGTRIVSADSHFLEDDIWFDYFPAHLKHLAPRMAFKNGGWEFKLPSGKATPMLVGAEQDRLLCDVAECVPGFNDVPARIKDLDAEGVEKELLFPQRLWSINLAGDDKTLASAELRDHYFGAYNEYMAKSCSQAPGRLYFVAIPNFWDPSGARDSIQKIKASGARGLMVPYNPRKDVNGEQIYWALPNMKTFWDAVEESGLPLCIHIGEGLPNPFPGAASAHTVQVLHNLVAPWTQLAFGGVFDRHPALKVVFVEAGIGWIPKMLHDADMVYHAHVPVFGSRTIHRPSWYWFNHCYATFATDPSGLEQLHRIGVDRVMWSSDYPHSEGTFGYTNDAIAAVFKATTVENAQKILGKTAINLFRMD